MQPTPLEIRSLEAFRLWLKSRGRSNNTIRAYVSDIQQFLNWAAINDPHELSADNIDRLSGLWIADGSSVAPATAARRMASVRLFAKVMYETDVLVAHSTPHPARGYAHPLPDGVDDLRRIIEAAPPRHQPLIALCGYAGARVFEARQVYGSDVTQSDDGAWWVRLHGKGNADRDVPLPDEAIPYLHLDTNPIGLLCPLGDRGARTAITNAARKAGVSRPVASHDLRMTFGTAVYTATKDLRVTQELLGHRNSSTTERYTGIATATKVNAVKGTFS